MTIGGVEFQQAVTIIINLIIIESLLSIDNAAVLATMVMDLPPHQRKRALKIGLIIGYILRGTCLLLATVLIKIWWLKLVGGGYLFLLSINYFVRKATPQKEDDMLNKKENWLYKNLVGLIGKFWATVLMVESMDLIFSIDNVLAAAAFTNVIWLIVIGVFIGILGMRFLAGVFVDLMIKFPFLETSAFVVLLLLGIKLILAAPCHFHELKAFEGICVYMEGEKHELLNGIFSAITISIFVLPIISSYLFNFQNRKTLK